MYQLYAITSIIIQRQTYIIRIYLILSTVHTRLALFAFNDLSVIVGAPLFFLRYDIFFFPPTLHFCVCPVPASYRGHKPMLRHILYVYSMKCKFISNTMTTAKRGDDPGGYKPPLPLCLCALYESCTKKK